MTTAQSTSVTGERRLSERYAEVPLGVECAWPMPCVFSQLPDGTPESSHPSSSIGDSDVGELSYRDAME